MIYLVKLRHVRVPTWGSPGHIINAIDMIRCRAVYAAIESDGCQNCVEL